VKTKNQNEKSEGDAGYPPIFKYIRQTKNALTLLQKQVATIAEKNKK